MFRARAFAFAAASLVTLSALGVGPRAWCGRAARDWYDGSPEHAARLGRAVSRELGAMNGKSFATGSARFDGEWRFGTALTAALGFGQTAIAHPELRAWASAELEKALDQALSPEARAFDQAAWGQDPIAALDASRGHAAYLGYLNLALSLARVVDPSSRFGATNDAFSAALERRFEASPSAPIETYPGERYPVDNAAGLASLVLRERAVPTAHRQIQKLRLEEFRAHYIDAKTGLLFQSVDEAGHAVDVPRGSGSALASYFLSFADPDLSHDLFLAVRRELFGTVLGFGVVREYPHDEGRGDIDSGPLVFGWSISAMGFSISGCKSHHDPACFQALFRSLDLFGAPHARGNEESFVSGGPLGDAILFAMLTALPAEHWRSH